MVTMMAIAGVVWIIVATVRRRLDRRRWQAPALSQREIIRRGWDER